MTMYCFHNNSPVHFTIVKDLQMIDLKIAFRSMIDRSGFNRSDRSFSRIVWPLVNTGIVLSSYVAVIRFNKAHCLLTEWHVYRIHFAYHMFNIFQKQTPHSFPMWMSYGVSFCMFECPTCLLNALHEMLPSNWKMFQWDPTVFWYHFYGLVQDSCISIALAMEIQQPCTKPSIYWSQVF